MKFTEGSDEIVIRRVPLGEWAAGGISLLLSGVFFFLVAHFFSDDLFDCLPVLGFVLISAFLFYQIKRILAPAATVSISAKTKAVEIAFKRIGGGETKRFYFSQIDKFKSYKGRANFSSKYFLGLVLANNKMLELKIPIGADRRETTKFVKKLNKFVKKAGGEP